MLAPPNPKKRKVVEISGGGGQLEQSQVSQLMARIQDLETALVIAKGEKHELQSQIEAQMQLH